jgi:lactoylglutathione lyase
MTNTVTNHVGLCVSNVERSRRFYEGLGFEFQRDLQPPDKFTAPLLGLSEPLGLTAVYLTMGQFVLELLHFEHSTSQPPQRRNMDDLGLTHLSLTVDDMPSTLAAVEDLGGQVVQSSDIVVAIMVKDPDGQLIELLTEQPG